MFEVKHNGEEKKCMVCVTKFSNISNQLKNVIHRSWSLLEGSRQEKMERPMFAFRRNKTISKL